VLTAAAMSLPFMHIINLAIEENDRWSRFVTFVGYIAPLATGVIMSLPTPEASDRQWSIVCCFAIPLKLGCCGKMVKNPLLYLHPLGIGLFIVLPSIINLTRMGTDNYNQWGVTLAGTIIIILGGIVYGFAEGGRLACYPEPPEAGKMGRIGFLAEVTVVFAAMMTYVHREMVGTAWCVGGTTGEAILLVILIIAAIMPVLLSIVFFARAAYACLCCCKSCVADGDDDNLLGPDNMYVLIVKDKKDDHQERPTHWLFDADQPPGSPPVWSSGPKKKEDPTTGGHLALNVGGGGAAAAPAP
jgi:hypothetical protein